MEDRLKIFIGFDSKETIAYHVLAHSFLERASKTVEIIPLKLSALQKQEIFTRENEGTTEFSLTRFLVPYLSDYSGWSLFIDCDMLCNIDIYEIFEEVKRDPFKAVYCCQHNYTPKTTHKATGIQTNYPKKNWSSVMLFDNKRCKTLTKEYVNSVSPKSLHRFEWAEDIGSLPLEYNWLVGEYEETAKAKILHYTLGTPCFPEYASCDNSSEWHKELEKVLHPIQK